MPKSGGEQTRIIFHLSYDCKKDGQKSLNANMPKHLCTMHYRDLDYAIQAYLRVCKADSQDENQFTHDRPQLASKWQSKFDKHKHKKTVFAGKTDIKSAFRILGLSANCWKWLVMKARDPTTGQWKYFIDKCLPFGASISCALFQKFSDALCYLFEYRVNTHGVTTNYLDDFLFLALTICHCNELIMEFLQLCKELNVPISDKKTEWANELIVFLGILLNGRDFSLGGPLEKRENAIKLLNNMLDKKKATVKDLQVLCGYLNFISKAVFPGRTFTRRMYSKFAVIIDTTEGKSKSHINHKV